MNNNLFDNIVKQKTSDHEAAVPADAWENIKQEKKKRRYPFFWWIFSFLLAGLSIFWINQARMYNTLANNKIITTNHQTREKNNPGNKDQTNSQNTHVKQPGIISSGTVAENKPGKTGPYNKIFKQPTKKITEQKTSAIQQNLFSRKKKKFNSPASTQIVIESPSTDTKDEENIFNDIPGASFANEMQPGLQRHISILEKIWSTFKSPNAINRLKIKFDNSTPIKKNKKKTGLDVELTAIPFFPLQQYEHPQYLKRNVVDSNTHAEFRADRLQNKMKPGIGIGLAVVKIINKKWRIGIGFQYASFKEDLKLTGTEVKYSVIKRLVNNPGGSFLKEDTIYNVSNGIRTINATNSYKSISVPLVFQHVLSTQKKWTTSLTGGVCLNVLNKYSNSIKGDFVPVFENRQTGNGSHKNITIDIYAGIRITGFLHKKYHLFAEPNIRYNVNKYSLNNSMVYKKIHRTGITLGVSYKLKK